MPKQLQVKITETENWTISKRAVNNELHKVDFSAVWLKANADDYPSTFEGMSRMRDDLMKILPCLPYKTFGVPKARLIPGARDAKHNPIYYDLYIWGRKEIIKPSIILSPKNKNTMGKPICSNCNDTGTDDFGGDMCANCNGRNGDVPDDLNLAPEPKDYPVGVDEFIRRHWKVADDIAADDPNAVIH